MNRQARQRLIEEISEQQRAGPIEIAVPLDLFFDGNDDRGSIGCNLGDEQPAIAEFYRTLSDLRRRPEVQDILVRICAVDDDESWPFADTVYVISSLRQSEIESALAGLRFDEVVAKWMYGKPPAVAEPRPGFTPYSVWWD
ncbi:hypothetical protein ACFW16_18930 [Inquilinus sp. NPDC058860]|uniref:hypothetical protein n=1 Tax=Inquilinus sp. NPDC058860 TaxID=3346652 RepID=UPI0036BA82A5